MTDRPPLHARYGISTFETFFDVDARRHLMPSVMDDVPSMTKRCACPGGGKTFIQCIGPYTQPDHLCDACRTNCFVNRNGETVSFIEHFGSAYPLHVGPIVIKSTITPTPHASRGGIIWALAPNGKRVHAYQNRRGLYPRSLCNQSQMHTWTDVRLRAGIALDVPNCGSCRKLASA